MEIQREKMEMGFKNGFFRDTQKLKDLKKYSKEWQKSSLEACRSDFLSKKWCGKRENARRMEFGIVTMEEEEEVKKLEE